MKAREAISEVARALGKLALVSVEVTPTPEVMRAAKAVDARIQTLADTLGEGDLPGVIDSLRGLAIDISRSWEPPEDEDGDSGA